MNRFRLSTALPAGLALVGLGLLAWWIGSGPVVPLEARVPGLDRPKGAAAVVKRPLRGELTKLADLSPSAQQPAGSWPCFRGEKLDGIAQATGLARKWPKGGPKVLWSTELGEGYAGAAVFGGRVYVLDYDRKAATDTLRCMALADGKPLWRYSYPVDIKRNHGMSRTVPYVTDRFVVSIGPKCHVSCLDPVTGREYWLCDMVEDFKAIVPPWYAGQCPLVDGGRAILAPGGDALVVAKDCQTGKILWQSPNPQGWAMTHVSIVPMEFAGRRMYVYCGKGGVAGVSATDGQILWDTTDWKISIATVPTPVVLPGGRIFFCGGYNAGSLILKLEEHGGRLLPKIVRRIKAAQFGATQHTPILVKDRLYGIREKDRELVCMDLEGNVRWASGAQHRFGLGPFLIADGLIYVLDDSGKLTLAELSPDRYRQLDAAQVLDGHDAWAPMALVGTRLILRDLVRMVCIEVGKQ
jgi:outer membrane protein assembly factor BamB